MVFKRFETRTYLPFHLQFAQHLAHLRPDPGPDLQGVLLLLLLLLALLLPTL